MEYEPIARLGRGGMGAVDLARDPDGNKVALKRLTLHGSASEIMRARQRLLREGKVLRRLRHPNIVRLLDVVEDDDEIVLVMPYLPGGNLSERVTQHGPAPPGEVERLGVRLLGALTEAHAAGIIHRDIKPANVLYDAEGEPRLADFGLAYTWDQSEALTVAGMVVGTPGFIAPEQARGEPLTPASDIFSLGATLLFAATGGGPFGNGDPGLLMVRAAAGKVEKIPKRLPAPLRRRLKRMLDARPERRPTAAALLTELSALAGQGGRGRRPRGLAVAGGVAATVLVATIVVIGTRGGDGDAGTSAADVTEPGNSGAPSDDGEPGTVPGQEEPPYPGEGQGEGEGEFEADEGRPLVDELEGTVGRGDDLDAYDVPLAQEPDAECPEQVRIRLEAPQNPPLLLEVHHNGQVLERPPGQEGPPVITVSPVNCSSDEVRVLVRVTERSADIPANPQPYVLQRVDVP